MDDDAVWEAILIDGWGPHVRDAAVRRVERRTTGRRGALARIATDPDGARFAWTEWLHGEVLAAIVAETGADLEQLGSQAAWACYEDVWDELTSRWCRGGNLGRVATSDRGEVETLLARLPAWIAERAGADIGEVPAVPLEIDGTLRIDVDGLLLCLDDHERPLDDATRRCVNQLLDRVR